LIKFGYPLFDQRWQDVSDELILIARVRRYHFRCFTVRTLSLWQVCVVFVQFAFLVQRHVPAFIVDLVYFRYGDVEGLHLLDGDEQKLKLLKFYTFRIAFEFHEIYALFELRHEFPR
jgi:hypothetical protein